MKHFHRFLILLITIAVAGMHVAPGQTQGIIFDDSDPTTIRLRNNFYEVGLRKSNGSIAYITDRATGQHISEGSRHECLWGSFGADASYVGGCSYRADQANAFSYRWSPIDARLSLSYTPDPASQSQASALVTLSVSTSAWFDLQIDLENHIGGTFDYVLFPSDLVFHEADIQAAYLPALPGVALNSSFFDQNRSYTASYPGELFADFLALTSQRGSIAIYALPAAEAVRPLVLGLTHDDEYLADSTYVYRSFGVSLPNEAVWTSPRIRVQVGQTISQTISAYRSDSGIAGFDSLATKAGVRYQQIVESPLLKADAVQLMLPFAQYADLLAQVPAPGIVHLVSFQPGGFDENYPDLLPPAPAWGSTDDMVAMVRQAQAMGFLVMPYTNPTWWDDQSPTMQAISVTNTLTDVAVLDRHGVPRYETYATHGGYVVSPYSSQVIQRLDQLIGSMISTIPSNLVFEDQIGARSWIFDHNPAEPSPVAYVQGWLEHTRTYRHVLLMTEGGFDRLAETELGFHGSVLLDQLRGVTTGRWGAGTWQVYPIAPLMLRDKVLFYQHNLAPETFTLDKPTLAWNLAFGYMLSYDLGLSSFGGGTSSPWLAVVTTFQREVLARYAGERMLNYTSLNATVTRSDFEHASVVTNWDSTSTYTSGPYTLAPSGVMVTSNDGGLVAGIFTGYNGHPLAVGEHYLIEERGFSELIVRQPMGDDTPLSIDLPPDWQGADNLAVEAWSVTGTSLGVVASTSADGQITFTYQQQVAGADVGYYRITGGYRVFLPLVVRGS